MKKTKEKQERLSFKDTFKVFGMIRVPWIWIILAFIANLGYNQVLLLIPSITAELSSGDLSSGAIWRAVGFYVLSFAASHMLSVANGVANGIGNRNARKSIWDRMLHIRLDYYDSNNPSELMSTISNDTVTAMQYIVLIAGRFIPNIYYAVVALKTIGDYNFFLMLSIFMILPIKILYAVFFGSWNYRTQVGIYNRIGGLTGYLSERIKHLVLIKTNTNVPDELKKGEDVAKQLYGAHINAAKYALGSEGAATFITVLQNVIVVVFGVICLQRGLIDVKQWIAFFMFSGTLSGKFTLLINDWLGFKLIQGGLARTAKIMNAPLEKKDKDAGVTEMPGTKDVVFENVSFAYGDKQALRDISFTVPEKTLTAIVGLCGSGKTTTLSLAEGFYTAKDGRVMIGGVNVNDISMNTLRSSVALVHQGAGIFSGTVREALSYGVHRELTDEEIMEAAAFTGADEYIAKCENGLDTEISAEGTSMSGGQRQRLVLTRELLKKTDIMLLDEPTSALDSITSLKIKDVIRRAAGEKTVIMVTHDLSLVDIADQIIVMQEGSIVGCGTLRQLLDSCELFREMAATQNHLNMKGCEC